MDSIEARVLVESGFYESQTCAVLYGDRRSKLDFYGLDLAFASGGDDGDSGANHLCEICNNFDFEQWYHHGSQFKTRTPRDWYLGLFRRVHRRSSYCRLCRFVCSIIQLNMGTIDFHELSNTMVTLVRHGNKTGRAGPGYLDIRLSRRYSFGWEMVVTPEHNHRIQFAENQGVDSLNLSRDWCIGRELPHVVDLSLVRSWIRTCELEHGEDCGNQGPLQLSLWPSCLKLLDVRSLRLVDAPRKCRYLALSYVWGKTKMPESQNIHTCGRIERDFAREYETFPSTIRDAIDLVRQLGERFIWIDSLCINHNDSQEKDTQIMQMGQIYASAVLTIVAAAGRDADAGLPGLREKSRVLMQSKAELHAATFLTVLPIGRDMFAGKRVVADSYWNKRGWTFQEELLSTRCLIFTAYQVYFRCRRESRAEDTCYPDSGALEEFPGLRPFFVQDIMLRIRKAKRLALYAEFISQYSRRSITNQADGLRAAYAGLQLYSLILESPLLWGLPEAIFDRVILWEFDASVSHPTTVSKRDAFPSWCWASWTGEKTYREEYSLMRFSVQWYKLLINGQLLEVTNDKINGHAEQKGGTGRVLMEQWSPGDYDPIDLTLPRYDSGRLAEDSTSGILVFWTTAMQLHVKPILSLSAGRESPYMECDIFTDGKLVNYSPLVIPKVWWVNQRRDTFEFITVGQIGKEFGVVLFLIEWDKGVAYRKGLVQFAHSDWERCPKIWKLITLG